MLCSIFIFHFFNPFYLYFNLIQSSFSISSNPFNLPFQSHSIPSIFLFNLIQSPQSSFSISFNPFNLPFQSHSIPSIFLFNLIQSLQSSFSISSNPFNLPFQSHSIFLFNLIHSPQSLQSPQSSSYQYTLNGLYSSIPSTCFTSL